MTFALQLRYQHFVYCDINATPSQDSNSKYESCTAQLYPKVVDKKSISSELIQTPGSNLES
jgi:hypothetical protein